MPSKGRSPPHEKISFLNCRGAGSQASEARCKDLAHDHDFDILCLAETKMDETRVWKLQRLFGRQWSVRVVPAIGFSGGIAMIWRHDRFAVESLWWSQQALYGIIT